ncbi:MAG: hypothetical protein EDR02_18355, partial [Actinobacteria bacterium]
PAITNRAGAEILKTGSGSATLGNSGVRFTNDGTIWVIGGSLRLDGDLAGLSGTTLTGGTWIVADGATLRLRGANVVTNAADIALLGPNANFVDHNDANALRNLAVNDGELSLQGKDLALSDDLTNNGTLALNGAEVTLAGDLALASPGRLEMAIAGTIPGTDYGRILSSGNAALDGTLAITTMAPFSPTSGTFTVIDAATVTGEFATVTGADIGNGSHYEVWTDEDNGNVALVIGEPAVPPAIAVSPQSMVESGGNLLVEVRGVGGNVAVTVPFQVLDGTATAPGDYTALLTPSTVTVPPDGSAFVAVPLVDDALDEEHETFTVDAGGSSATMTILDDDLPPVAVIDGLSITEGDDGTVDAELSVRLVDPLLGLLPQESGRIVTVWGATREGSAVEGEDYVGAFGNIVFNPGETTRAFAVSIIGDEEDEGHESFTVDLAAISNATVAEDESATVIIVDDDGSGNAQEIADQLEAGGASLFGALDEWGDAFDLDGFDAIQQPMFELPGLTDDLASLFEPQDDLGGLQNPFENLGNDLEALCDQLEGLGLTIDWVEGGVCGASLPPTAPDIFQARYEVTLADLVEALGFSGDELNDDAQGVLEGLAASLDLDADFSSGADLVVTLVVGVDETGFYVADESGLRLDVSAIGAVTGAGSLTGIEGLTIGGTADADVAVSLLANGGPARLRLADLAGSPMQYLRPAASGTVSLSLGAALEPLTVSWDGTFTLDVDESFETSIEVDSTLEATLTLPGLTESGDPALFTLLGTYDSQSETWTLTGSGEVDADYTLGGFSVTELGFTVVLTPTALLGSASADLEVGLGGPETPLTLACAPIAFDHTALHVECHLALGEAILGADPALVYLGGTTVDGVFDGDIATGELTGGIDVAADTLVVLPEPAAPGQVPAGAARADNVTGSLDSEGNLSLHAGTLSGSIGGEIDFTATDVDLTLGPDATGPLFSVDTVSATIPSLNGLGVTFSGFHLNRDGTFGADAINVESQGFLQTIGLAGILPFDITEVAVDFPDHEDLDTFDVTVAGRFDFAPLAALPFIPVIGVGDDAVTPSSPPEDNHFTFSIAVESLSEGRVRPWDLGPITLGFDDLEVGDVTLGGQLTLGGYQDGEWVDDFGGTLSIESGLDGIEGEATVDVGGTLDITPTGATLDLSGTFSISADLSEDVRIEGAQLDFALGVAVDEAWNFTVTGPTLDGAGVERIEIAFGEFMRLVGSGVDIDFSPAPGDPLVAFGGSPGDGSLAVEFDEGVDVLSGWGGEAGNFAIAADFTPMLLPGFFLDIAVPDSEQFGLPDWLPLRVDEVGIRFPDVDFGNIPEGGLAITDLGAFAIRFSGGLEANETWPISAAVDGLEVDLAKLVNGEFPITNLDGFLMGVEPFELVPGFEIGGGLELKTIEVDGNPAPGEQIEDVFYGRIFGTFEYEGLGAGLDLVVTQYGPVLAQVQVPLAIPIDGGLLGGILLSSVVGGIEFGGVAFPDPQSPLEILHDPAFDTDFPVDDDTIRAAVEPAVQQEVFTWDVGFTLALSGKLTHAMAPAIVSGDVTIGANIGLVPGQQGLKLIGSGDISAWGMEFAGAALLIDLADPLAPTFDFAFETPQLGNPLSFLLPAQATFEASLDTRGILAGFGLGVATFVERAASGSLEVGQDFFDAGLEALATSLEADHSRPLARLLLDSNGDGEVSGAEDSQVITRDLLTSRAVALMGGGGLPSDPASAGRAARMFVAELLVTAAELVDDFDLSEVFTHADYAAFAQLLGAGGEAIAALLGVVRDAVLEGGQAFLSQFDPSFHLRGMLQPIILGIPFGAPQHEVELIISKTGLGFGFDTSIGDIGTQICARIIPFIGGAICTAMSLGFEDHLGMTFELPLGGIVEGLFGGTGLPTLDPWSGDWAIELRGGLRWLDFEVGQMSGLIVAADNRAFLDARVQKLWEDPDAPLDPNRIPIQTEQHYLDILEHGGILLTGRLMLPELLTDPVGLLAALDLEVPDDIADMPDWVAAIADHLSRVVQPATVQLFVPGFGAVFEADFDAPTEAGRLTPVGSGRSLAAAVNDISDAAYLEGTFDGTLLSMPFGKALVEARGDKIAVTGELPLIGVSSRFDLDINEIDSPIGPVPFPRAASTTTVDESVVDDVLERLGLPSILSSAGNVDATYRAFSPGYDPTSADALQRFGGAELQARLDVASIVRNANFTMKLAFNGDVTATAGVASFTPVPGVRLTNGHVGFTKAGADFAGTLGGTVNLSGWLRAVLGVSTITVEGTYDSAGNVSLYLVIDGETYDLIALLNATIDQIVDFLFDLGWDFVEVAGLLYDQVTRNVTTIVDQLVRKGADYVELAEALFDEVTTNVTTIVDQLVRKGADFVELAEALFDEVTTNVTTIVDQLVRKGADFVELAEALYQEVTRSITTIVDQLVRKGADFAELAEALFEEVTRSLQVLVTQLVRKGADFVELAEALDGETSYGDQAIINAIDDFTSASLADLVDALEALGRTALGTIIDMLEAIGYTDIRELAEALDDATSVSYRRIAEALDDFTSASFSAIGDALRFAGASFGTIVDALDWATNASVNQIADAIRYAGATFTQVMQALEDELSVNRYDTAAQLDRLGAGIIDILEALVDVYNAGFDSLVNVLVSLGVAAADAIAAVNDFLFG